MKKQIIICDITGKPDAVSLKLITKEPCPSGNGYVDHCDFLDIDIDLLVKRLNIAFQDGEYYEELWKELKRKESSTKK